MKGVDFAFTSSKSINFGPTTSGLKSPTTIRQVRPSGIFTPLPSSLDDIPPFFTASDIKKIIARTRTTKIIRLLTLMTSILAGTPKKQKMTHKEEKTSLKLDERERAMRPAGVEGDKGGVMMMFKATRV